MEDNANNARMYTLLPISSQASYFAALYLLMGVSHI